MAAMKRFWNLEWDAVAGVIAAVGALVLNLLQVADVNVVLAVMLAILALILVRDLRREVRDQQLAESVVTTAAQVKDIRTVITPPDAVLIGPRALRAESERFAAGARGDMVWFNVCLLMFAPQALFDAMLRPAIENPLVRSIRFVLDEGERERWSQLVLPKVAKCAGREKVAEPEWCRLKEPVSFILAGTTASGETEGHLSFWGEPFMARRPGHDIPRYVFHVLSHSELIGRLVDMERAYRTHGPRLSMETARP